MTAREVLAQCRTAIAEIAALERMIDKLMDIGAPAGGIGGSGDRVGGRTNDPAAARMPFAKPETPDLPRDNNLDGSDISAFTIACMTLVPALRTAPTMDTIPFLIAVTACFPRFSQLNAENTETIA